MNLANIGRAVALVWETAPGLTLIVVILILLQAGGNVLQLYLTKRFLDSVIGELHGTAGNTFHRTVFWIALGAGNAWLVAILRAWSQYANERQAELVSESVQNMIAVKSTSVDLSYYENPEYFDTLHGVQLEAPFRPARIITALTDAAQSAISLFAVGGILVLYFGPAILAGLALVVACGSLARFANIKAQYHWRKLVSAEERVLMYFNWLLNSATVAKEVRVFNLGKALLRRVSLVRTSLREKKLRISRRRTSSEVTMQFSVCLATFLATLYLARQTLASGLTVGGLVMNFQALQRCAVLMQQLTAGISQLYEHALFLTRFFEFLELKNVIDDAASVRRLDRKSMDGIEFRNVTFQYPATPTPTLQGVSFRILPGQMVALVGENGAGKSTLLKLLCRLYEPTNGLILLGGVDIREYSREELWANVAALFQDFVQYQATVRDNICFDGQYLNIPDESISRAAEKAGASEIIDQLPKQYDQMLGRMFEGGAELSGGQWQKMALSRAFYRDALIVLLDEPTSALDVSAEHDFLRRFTELARGKMSLVVSHRLSTVRQADLIVYLENGCVKELGTHDELIAHDGAYATLFTKQAGQYR